MRYELNPDQIVYLNGLYLAFKEAESRLNQGLKIVGNELEIDGKGTVEFTKNNVPCAINVEEDKQ